MNYLPSVMVSLVGLFLAAGVDAATLDVEADYQAGTSGKVYFSIYRDADSFLKQPLAVVSGDMVDGVAIARFADLSEGEYAVSAYLDRDGDGNMKRNFIGIPREPVGTSNDVRPKFGAPAFKDARFQLGAEPLKLLVPLHCPLGC